MITCLLLGEVYSSLRQEVGKFTPARILLQRVALSGWGLVINRDLTIYTAISRRLDAMRIATLASQKLTLSYFS